ncbi:BTB and MATH domain-containing protein 36-like [Haliotis rufescens]|uniref:BTB and MATH domain-containing protein 36-like n=1 Tax=Haliotis rufescens TaxID=6454 RepID=UPI00201FB140|nr:BTB and MATH domain-containing protein 36-like [Haliotis rufescens]
MMSIRGNTPLFGLTSAQGQIATGFNFGASSNVKAEAVCSMGQSEAEQEITTSVFDKPSSTSDMTLAVEGRQLHVNRGVLVAASVVFEKMFEGEFKEKNEIPLPDKSYADVVDMLLRIYPSELKSITRSKVDKLLGLADEYKMTALTQKCERFLLYQCNVMTSSNSTYCKELVHYIYLADKYHLEVLLTRVTDMASHLTFGGNDVKSVFGSQELDASAIVNHKEYLLMSETTQLLLAVKRIAVLENICVRAPVVVKLAK